MATTLVVRQAAKQACLKFRLYIVLQIVSVAAMYQDCCNSSGYRSSLQMTSSLELPNPSYFSFECSPCVLQ